MGVCQNSRNQFGTKMENQPHNARDTLLNNQVFENPTWRTAAIFFSFRIAIIILSWTEIFAHFYGSWDQWLVEIRQYGILKIAVGKKINMAALAVNTDIDKGQVSKDAKAEK